MRMLLPHPERKTVEKKINFLMKYVLFSLLSLCFTISGKAQSISISNFAMPDTVTLNFSTDVFFQVKNTSDSLNILGNLKLNFLNETTGGPAVPLGGFDAMQFFAPQQERAFEVVIDITPQYFLEGGNTIVIWPSFAAQQIESQDSIRFNLYVNHINGIDQDKNQGESAYLIPNPVKGELFILPVGKAELPESITVRSLNGQILLNQRLNGSGKVDMLKVAPGVYILEMSLTNGERITQRIVRIAE
jgi:hypothetical protein